MLDWKPGHTVRCKHGVYQEENGQLECKGNTGSWQQNGKYNAWCDNEHIEHCKAKGYKFNKMHEEQKKKAQQQKQKQAGEQTTS
jgi:predicted glycosyl hydrolase (DUF1957 family)